MCTCVKDLMSQGTKLHEGISCFLSEYLFFNVVVHEIQPKNNFKKKNVNPKGGSQICVILWKIVNLENVLFRSSGNTCDFLYVL